MLVDFKQERLRQLLKLRDRRHLAKHWIHIILLCHVMIGQRTRWEKEKARFHRAAKCMIMIKRIQRKMHLKIPQRGPTLDERNRRIARSAMTYGGVMTRRETIGVAKKTLVAFLRGANRRMHQPRLRFAIHKSYIVDIQRRFRFIR